MFINGTYELLYIKTQDSLDYYPIACITDQSFSESSDTIETTTRDNSGWKTSKPTNQEYSISFSGLEVSVYENQKVNFRELQLIKRNRELVEWKIGTGDYYFGSGFITELSLGYPIDDNVTFDGTLIGYGKYNTISTQYIERVEADGGTIDRKECLIDYINEIA